MDQIETWEAFKTNPLFLEVKHAFFQPDADFVWG